MIVSVVTSSVSDDCNSVVLDAAARYLRVAGLGTAFACTTRSTTTWRFVRYFALPSWRRGLAPGFSVQSPAGDGCAVTLFIDRVRPRCWATCVRGVSTGNAEPQSSTRQPSWDRRSIAKGVNAVEVFDAIQTMLAVRLRRPPIPPATVQRFVDRRAGSRAA